MRPLAGVMLLLAGLVLWGWLRAPFAYSTFQQMIAEREEVVGSQEVAVGEGERPVRSGRESRTVAASTGGRPTLITMNAAGELEPNEPALSPSEGGPNELEPPRETQAQPLPRHPAADRENAPALQSRAATPAYLLAEQGYAALGAGDRRLAADRLAAAMAAGPREPQASAWRRELRALRKRLFLSAYIVAREDGRGAAPAALPGFGGSQQGAGLRYVLDPLARRPVSVNLRWTRSPHGRETSQELVAGVGWRPLGRRGPLLSAERRFGLQGGAVDAFQVRASGGIATGASDDFDLSAYADVGLVDLDAPRAFAGAQTFAGYRLRSRLSAGAGAWASWQEGAGAQRLVEAGPALRAAIPAGPTALRLAASYRFRLEGDGGPAHGPALTLSAAY